MRDMFFTNFIEIDDFFITLRNSGRNAGQNAGQKAGQKADDL